MHHAGATALLFAAHGQEPNGRDIHPDGLRVRRNPERHDQAHELEQQEGGDRLNPASAQVIDTSPRGRALRRRHNPIPFV
jgi:hypothetical protein